MTSKMIMSYRLKTSVNISPVIIREAASDDGSLAVAVALLNKKVDFECAQREHGRHAVAVRLENLGAAAQSNFVGGRIER